MRLVWAWAWSPFFASLRLPSREYMCVWCKWGFRVGSSPHVLGSGSPGSGSLVIGVSRFQAVYTPFLITFIDFQPAEEGRLYGV